jgi:hypothetical protein
MYVDLCGCSLFRDRAKTVCHEVEDLLHFPFVILKETSIVSRTAELSGFKKTEKILSAYFSNKKNLE